MRQVISLAILGSLLVLSMCEKPSEPPPPDPPATIELEVVEVGLHEVWLRVRLRDSLEPRMVRLLRDHTPIVDFELFGRDSVFRDENLQMASRYLYQAIRVRSDRTDETKVHSATTLDTTHQSYTWQFSKLGDGNASELNDVFIVNDSEIWAVGEVYKKDSSGQFTEPPFNVVRWDGASWNLERVSLEFRGNTIAPPMNGVFVYRGADAWLISSLPNRMDGDEWEQFDLRAMPGMEDVSLLRAWGTRAPAIHAVGRSGSIVHFDGLSWRRLYPSSSADILDIHGNGLFGDINFAVASSSSETRILSLNGGELTDTLGWSSVDRLRGIWVSNTSIYVSGPGVWQYRGGNWSELAGLAQHFYTRVRGNTDNNVVAISWGGVIAQYNGNSWQRFVGIPSDYNFEAVAVTNSRIVAVGFAGQDAVIAMGTRIP